MLKVFRSLNDYKHGMFNVSLTQRKAALNCIELHWRLLRCSCF